MIFYATKREYNKLKGKYQDSLVKIENLELANQKLREENYELERKVNEIEYRKQIEKSTKKRGRPRKKVEEEK